MTAVDDYCDFEFSQLNVRRLWGKFERKLLKCSFKISWQKSPGKFCHEMSWNWRRSWARKILSYRKLPILFFIFPDIDWQTECRLPGNISWDSWGVLEGDSWQLTVDKFTRVSSFFWRVLYIVLFSIWCIDCPLKYFDCDIFTLCHMSSWEEHRAWDLEGTHKTVWAVGLGKFDPCKKCSHVQAEAIWLDVIGIIQEKNSRLCNLFICSSVCLSCFFYRLPQLQISITQ